MGKRRQLLFFRIATAVVNFCNSRVFDVDNFTGFGIVEFFKNCEKFIEILNGVLVIPVGQYCFPSQLTFWLCRLGTPPFYRALAVRISSFSGQIALVGSAANYSASRISTTKNLFTSSCRIMFTNFLKVSLPSLVTKL